MAIIDTLHEKRDDVIAVARQHGVASIKVFGSVARREETAQSDVDFLVRTGADVSAWFPAGLILDLEALLGRPIDIVTEQGLNSLLREQVMSEAIPI